MSSTKNLITYLAGVATGVSIGMLFAPEKGEVTRDRLAYRLGNYRDQLQALVNEYIENGDADVGENSAAKAESRKVVSEAREKAESLLRDVEGLMLEIKAKREDI